MTARMEACGSQSHMVANQKARSSGQRQGWSIADELPTPWDPYPPTPPPSPKIIQPPQTVLPAREHMFETREPLADNPHSHPYMVPCDVL